jgi:hypothetical protein
MTSGNGTERSSEEPSIGDVDPSLKGCTTDPGDSEDTTVDPAPAASAERPRNSRRKAGVEYRPI